MIDAYTIGITIALEDGVSAGVATIKQDLLALDRAIQATTAGLLALRRLGQQASVVAHIDSTPVASHAPASLPPPGAATPPPDAIASGDPNVASPPTSTPISPLDHRFNAGTTIQSQATLAERPLPVSEVVNRAPQPRPARPSGSQPIAPHVPPQSNDQNAVEWPASIQLRQIAEFAPRPLQAHQEVVVDPVPPPPPPRAAPVPDAAFSPSQKTTPAAPFPAAVAPPPVPLRSSSPPATFFCGRPTEPPASRPGAASNRGSTHEDRPPPLPSSRQAPERWSAAPPASRPEASTARVSGDVMLDGSRLGRWISNSLTSMAERVPSGATGIDPRASVGWPAIQAD